MTTPHVRPLELPDDALEGKPLAPPSAEPVDGPIQMKGLVTWASDDRRVITGVWESEPGRSRWEFLTRGEIVHILAGVLVTEEDDGEPVELTAGSCAVFPNGWRGTWTVVEPVRKHYVVFKP